MIFIYDDQDTTPICPYAEPTYTLYKGRLAQNKEYVKWLQWHLIQAGTLEATTPDGKDNIDGELGSRTDEGFYQFQLGHPETYTTIFPDRMAGYKTRNALKQCNE